MINELKKAGPYIRMFHDTCVFQGPAEFQQEDACVGDCFLSVMLDFQSSYIAAGANNHPSAADWNPDTGLLAFGADQNVALWEPVVGFYCSSDNIDHAQRAVSRKGVRESNPYSLGIEIPSMLSNSSMCLSIIFSS